MDPPLFLIILILLSSPSSSFSSPFSKCPVPTHCCRAAIIISSSLPRKQPIQMTWLCRFPAWANVCVHCRMDTCMTVHTSCWGWAVADVWASAWRLSRCLLNAYLYCEKKHKADWGAHMDHLETIILREIILRPLGLSLDSSPRPSLPISSLKEVYASCLFFGLIAVKREDQYNWIALFIKLWWLREKVTFQATCMSP